MKVMPCTCCRGLKQTSSSDLHNCMILQALYPQLTNEKIKTELNINDLPLVRQLVSAQLSLQPRFRLKAQGFLSL